MFNEGYSASSGAAVTRADLCAEAIELARLLAALLPRTEVLGLLALLLLHDSRRAARTSPSGELVLLADQERSLWNRSRIDEALDILRRAWERQPIGTYTIQAAIAAEHAKASAPGSTGVVAA